MSTRARKERKRSAAPAVLKPPKVATPAEDRIENQPKSIYPVGPLKARRFGLTPAAARRLRARGIDRQYEGPEEGPK